MHSQSSSCLFCCKVVVFLRTKYAARKQTPIVLRNSAFMLCRFTMRIPQNTYNYHNIKITDGPISVTADPSYNQNHTLNHSET